MTIDGTTFRNIPHKAVTIMGMSGLGKTTLAEKLKPAGWYHYSADYRIGTAYCDQAIRDNIHEKIRHVEKVGPLLESGTIAIRNDITIDNLQPLSNFIGQIGNPEQGGLSYKEFIRRQALYNEGEVAAMKDVPAFINKARDKGFDHFVNDSSGSLCEITDENVFRTLAEQTVILYIEATKDDEEELLQRAAAYPKPLYFPQSFLDPALVEYKENRGIAYNALIDPDDFSRWVFPKLFYSRLPKYKRIAGAYGCTISADEARTIATEADFIALVGDALDRRHEHRKA